MSSETEIYFPDILPFPFTVRSLPARVSEHIKHGQKILNYAFVYKPSGASSTPETRFGSWDATFEGELKSWNVKVGDTITRERARTLPALRIMEPCKHGIQFNGLCALCGMNMDHFDYTGRAESSRATIQMTHSASGPTVSFEEAQRLEQETAEHLLKSRKLSLIVDLDQTIVHATVDPTVGDWITEGEAWEERQARREAKRKAAAAEGEKDDSEDSDSSEDDSDEDEVNPNWDALKDVKKFRLPPDNFGTPGSRWRGKPSEKSIQNDGCLYYVKPRPGWKEFLASVASRYEMHVYTMGTRAYAEKVCAAIDPDGRLFGGRILSRDESGSLTQKSLRRLFPCDTSMVVIIDDRADVWEWSPNLIKVIPYDFFIGIGDINSTFLPKVDAMGASNVAQTPASSSTTDAPPPTHIPSSPTPSLPVDDDEPGSDEVSDEPTDDRPSVSKSDMIARNALALEAQVEERPLAKKQEELESDDDDTEKSNEVANTCPPNDGQSNGTSPVQADQMKAKHHRKALLKNDDDELLRVGRLLDEVHARFFAAYDNRLPGSNRQRKSVGEREIPFDVKYIIPSIRKETFKGVHVLFSGVIPTNIRMDHEMTEIWRMARAFGATCHKDLTKEVTHVVAAKRGTQKVEKANSQPGIFVVWLQWFTDSVAQWKRQDERRYLLDAVKDTSPQNEVASSSPPSDPNAVSSDTDPEGLVGDGDDDLSEDLLEEIQNSESLAAPTGGAAGVTGLDTEASLNLNEVDWQEVNDEVDAAMMESDSEDVDDDSDRRSVRSSNDIEDESYADNRTGSLRPERKRLRSVTPSEPGQIPDELRSPLAKRKRVAADRSGMSKLKTAVSADELTTTAGDDGSLTNESSNPGTPTQENGSNASLEGDDETEDGEEIDEDFLARELEEELG
ncbi:FCP1 [Sanghuangporus sanghuang]